VGAIDERSYGARVLAAISVLRGDGGSLLAELVAKRDALADLWRFEEAANVRDQIRALEHILGAQRRLDSVAERNLAIAAPSTRAGLHELFLVRAGQLVRQLTVGRTVRRPTIVRALASAFSSHPATVSRERVDEMHLLDAWLRRHRERATVVEVDPADPTRSVDDIIRAIRPRLAKPA
jgi:excinuclease UvrABC nuclease subunit